MDSERWRVFKTTIHPSEQAKREAWELSAREQLPVVWAVPIDGRQTLGSFWAFFPLRDDTTLTGIANAPWQINDDRTGMLEGSQLNIELLDALSELVLSNVHALVKRDDPGWVLDVIPARGREPRSWGDDYLTTLFYRSAVDRPVLPDQERVLRRAADLQLPPGEASRMALEVWAVSPWRPTDWVHATAVTTATRRSRVERLFEAVGRSQASVAHWLGALVRGRCTPDQSAQAVRTAAAFITGGGIGELDRRAAVHGSRIILDRDGSLALAKPGEIFTPASSAPETSLIRLVHPGSWPNHGSATRSRRSGSKTLRRYSNSRRL